MSWLTESLSSMSLSETTEGYLLSRGMKPDTIQLLECKTWQPLESPIEDSDWRKQCGPKGHGEYLINWLIVPFCSPRGQIFGFEARKIDQKKIHKYLLPEGKWQPLFIGLHHKAMSNIWQGFDVWIVEGTFDLAALEWVVPENDVVLATVRASLSQRHIDFLQRYVKGWVHMVYDMDQAGQAATHGFVDPKGNRKWGALDKLRFAGIKARSVSYPKGKDPGEIWLQGGVGLLKEVFQQKV